MRPQVSQLSSPSSIEIDPLRLELLKPTDFNGKREKIRLRWRLSRLPV